MRRRRLILLAAACAVLAGGMIWFLTREREPSYNGKRLSEWLDQYWSNSVGVSVEASVTKKEEASAAVGTIGTKALPWLMGQVRKPSRLWPAFLDNAMRLIPRPARSAVFGSDTAYRRNLTDPAFVRAGFRILGSNAVTEIPELKRLMDTSSDRMVSDKAVLALSRIGKEALPPLLEALADRQRPNRTLIMAGVADMIKTLRTNAGPAVPMFVELLGDRDQEIAVVAAGTLGWNRLIEMSRAMQVLTNCLLSPKGEPTSRYEAALYIGQLGTNALPAVPSLVAALDDSSPWVREGVTNALRQIAPEALERSRAGEAEKP